MFTLSVNTVTIQSPLALQRHPVDTGEKTAGCAVIG